MKPVSENMGTEEKKDEHAEKEGATPRGKEAIPPADRGSQASKSGEPGPAPIDPLFRARLLEVVLEAKAREEGAAQSDSTLKEEGEDQ